MKNIKCVSRIGCVFLGKGIVGHPEMGAIVEAVLVTFDKKDIFGNWEGDEEDILMVRTDNGFAFDAAELGSHGHYQIEEYAPNWRAENEFYPWKR